MAIVAVITNPRLSKEGSRAFERISTEIAAVLAGSSVVAGGSLGWRINVADEHAEEVRTIIRRLIEQEGIAAQIVDAES